MYIGALPPRVTRCWGRDVLWDMRSHFVAVATLLVATGFCQVRPVYSSVESHAAAARVICVGRIVKIEDVKIDAWEAAELTIEVTETLKGRPQKSIKANRDRQYEMAGFEAARKAGAEFVWFIPKDTARTGYCLEPSFSEYRLLGGLAIGMDLTILRTRQELLARIRKFLKENPDAKGGAALLTPLPGQSLTGFVDFLIPLCPWTEKLAVRMITKPESFTFGPPTGTPTIPHQNRSGARARRGCCALRA